MKNDEYIEYLLHKYFNDSISAEDKKILFELISKDQCDNLLSKKIISDLNSTIDGDINDLDVKESEALLYRIIPKSHWYNKTRIYKVKRIAVLSMSSAALFIFVFFVWLSFKKYSENYGQIANEVVQKQFVKYHNNSDSIQQVLLSDLSTIDLYPQSIIHYPETFKDQERIVFLKGKAFFVISRDSIHPFIVYSENLKTRVLGTSFMINFDSETGLEEVEVRTGKVQIMENISLNSSANSMQKSLVLMPNQKGVYDSKIRQLNKTLATIPQPIIVDEKPRSGSFKSHNYDYEQTSLPEVFKDLETSYGVNIVMENTLLANCSFTGSLTNSNLFTKLQIICLTTQSTYEVVGTDIIIRGKGCR